MRCAWRPQTPFLPSRLRSDPYSLSAPLSRLAQPFTGAFAGTFHHFYRRPRRPLATAALSLNLPPPSSPPLPLAFGLAGLSPPVSAAVPRFNAQWLCAVRCVLSLCSSDRDAFWCGSLHRVAVCETVHGQAQSMRQGVAACRARWCLSCACWRRRATA